MCGDVDYELILVLFLRIESLTTYLRRLSIEKEHNKYQ
jgi:hypothetical protein